MIQYFKNIDSRTVEIKEPENGAWVNITPPLKQAEFEQLSEELDIPLDFLTDETSMLVRLAEMFAARAGKPG